MSVLESYWPSIDEVNRCIKAEAESTHESLLLAVHQPMSLWKQPINSPASGKARSEKDLLAAFLSNNLDTGTLLIPITGASGSGKSHAIRWLHAQLLRRPDADRFHIIRIPKSASLKTVIQLILEPLRGEHYEKILRDLVKATEAISLDNAVIQFRAGLEMALKKYSKELKNEINNNPEKRKILSPLLGHTIALPSVFKDSELSKFFDSHVLLRIIKRAIKGQDFDQIGSPGEEFPQFHEHDLELPEDVNLALAGHVPKKYYLATLGKPEERKSAIEVLNKVVGNAIGITFKLDENLGGKTLQEIILEIRVNLLKDKKELLLLVEDFAALTGIQETLLNICIQEAIRENKQVLCTMRTALALTDGYLGGRDTIATRAKYEWVVRSELDTDEAILTQVTNITGAYLNAARYGEKNVKKLFHEYDSQRTDLNSWLVPYQHESIDVQSENTLEAFDRSSQNNHLFPFNKRCLHHLAKIVLMKGGKLFYNPRVVINRIVRETLLNNRDYFMKGIFPPSEFNNAQVKTDIAILLSQKVPAFENSRYQSFLCFWGGDPDSPKDLESIHPFLYEVFSLQPLTKEYTKPKKDQKPSQNIKKDSSPIRTTGTQTVDEVKFSAKWEKVLEAWVSGRPLGPEDAKEIKKALSIALNKFIDWNVVNLPKPDLNPFSLFWIPPKITKGNPSGDRIIKISPDTKDSDGKLRKALLGLLRHKEHQWTWDYEEGQNDSIYFANYLEKISEEVVSLFRNEADKELVPLAQGLLLGTLVLGTKSIAVSNSQKLIEAMLFEGHISPPEIGIGENDKWEEIRMSCYDLMPILRREFIDKCACFQGATGQKALAINYVKLHQIFKEISFYNDIEMESLNKYFEILLKENNQKRVLQSLKAQKLQSPTLKFKKKMIDWHEIVNEVLGNKFDKDGLLEKLENVIKVIKKEGSLWPSEFDQRKLNALRKDFRESPVKEYIDILDRLENGGDELTEVIPILAKLDPVTYRTVDSFINRFELLIGSVEKKVSVQEQEYEAYDSTPVIAEINETFKEISSDLQKLKEDH